MFIRRCDATAPKRGSSTRCRRAPTCTTISAITPTSRSSMPFSSSARVRTREACPPKPEEDSVTTDAALTSAPKAKKSVALSGVTAGNTALCTVGRTGNDLAYRGYDILDLAQACEFEEVAYLLIHGKLPNAPELRAYKEKLTRLRGLPAQLRNALEQIPAAVHPMDV